MDRDEEARCAFIGVSYVTAVLEAGGVPFLVPPGEHRVAPLCEAADGLVITGGAFDIHPSYYGELVEGRLDRVEQQRTETELALARHAFQVGLPMLGICGGLQVLAVARGGRLIQDLPADPTHEQPTSPLEPWHDVSLAAPLSHWLGEHTRVNSTHHQSVAFAGEGGRAVGHSPDGVLEAVIYDSHPFALGVQWHPERLGDWRLYERLVLAAASRRCS